MFKGFLCLSVESTYKPLKTKGFTINTVCLLARITPHVGDGIYV